MIQAYAAHHFEESPCIGENKDDWFIPDILTEEKLEEYLDIVPVPYAVVPYLEERRKAARLACYYDCPMATRLLCLDEGLRPENVQYGIWGGYTESQRRAVRRAAAERGHPVIDHRAMAESILSAEKRESRST